MVHKACRPAGLARHLQRHVEDEVKSFNGMQSQTILFSPGLLLLNIFLMNMTCTAETAITARHSEKDHHFTRRFVEDTTIVKR